MWFVASIFFTGGCITRAYKQHWFLFSMIFFSSVVEMWREGDLGLRDSCLTTAGASRIAKCCGPMFLRSYSSYSIIYLRHYIPQTGIAKYLGLHIAMAWALRALQQMRSVVEKFGGRSNMFEGGGRRLTRRMRIFLQLLVARLN